MAVVLIGVVFSAFFASVVTGSSASNEYRNLVTMDGLLRNYAEATKAAVRSGCGVASPTTYTPPTMSATGFSFSSVSNPPTNNCPSVSLVQQVDLTVTQSPNGPSRSLSIELRTP